MSQAATPDLQQQTAEVLRQEPSDPMLTQFNLLFMGNSHSSSHNLPQLVATLLQSGLPNAKIDTKLASGYHFLDERLQHNASTRLLKEGNWSHVILQAQKYSTTGRYFYPTDAAEEWIRRINTKNAQAIMFPEWPRRGNKEEGARIHQLHLSIAKAEPACVAPIGLAWERALQQNPGLKLHASDGNHAAFEGAFLTALVLYGTISKQDPADLDEIRAIKLSRDTQAELRQAASATLRQHVPCAEK
ncbi:MAG TPA: hypothetical protein VFY01_04715 [Rheinheimera sp.]|nr:hypothetical protein [Rheinheimera sp.]